MIFFTDQYVKEGLQNPGIHTKRLKEKLTQNGFSFDDYDTGYAGDEDKLRGSSGMFFAVIGDEVPPQGEAKVVFSRDYIQPLVDELKNNPNCSFKTMYNDLIQKDGYTPKFFSAIVKDCHGQYSGITSEIFGSKMANLLGIPTNYAFGIKYNDGQKHAYPNGKVLDYFAVASIDYLSQGQEIEMFCDIDKFKEIFNNHDLNTKQANKEIKQLGFHRAKDETSLEDWMKYINSSLENRYPDGVDQESYKQFVNDFVQSYLFRVVLCEDGDFACYNCGILTEENSNKFSMIPNTDMEGLLNNRKYEIIVDTMKSKKKFVRNAVESCRRLYPEILDEFISKLENNFNAGKIGKVMEEVYPKNQSNSVFLENFNNDVKYMIDCYNNPSKSILTIIKDKLNSNEMER